MGHHAGMADPWAVGNTVIRNDLPEWEGWVYDYNWHRNHHKQSRFRWDPADVMKLITTTTKGQLEFTQPDDLVQLEDIAEKFNDYCESLLVNITPHLERAINASSADAVADAWSITQFGLVARIRAYRLMPGNSRADWILRDLYLSSNPLVRGWELLQHWAIHDGAHRIILNTLGVLAFELAASGPASELQAHDQIAAAMRYLASWGITEAPAPMEIPRQDYRF